MTRYTNFGSWVQINEFTNEMRKVEIEDAPANTIIAHSLSLHAPPTASPPGAAAAGSPSTDDDGAVWADGSLAGLAR